MSLLVPFLAQAVAHPERTALIDRNGVAISYGALNRRAAAWAGTLARHGLGVRQTVEQRITRVFVPPVVPAALATVALPGSLRRVLTGGGPLYPDVAQRFLATSPGVGLTVVYGSTEAEPISHLALETLDPALWSQAAAGGGLPVGEPVPEARVRIVGGEILVTGSHVNRGGPVTRICDPAREGDTVWHRTGDAGRLDDQGRLWLLGRLGSIPAGGLFPFAVESAARLWPGVRGAALAASSDQALLFLAGDANHRDAWQSRASALGDVRVVVVRAIPMDRRHRSKPDVATLLKAYRRRVA